MNNSDIFSGLPPSSSQSIVIPAVAMHEKDCGASDTIFEIEKVLMGDQKPEEKNTIDFLMDEMAINAAQKEDFDNSANIDLTSNSF